MAGVGDSAHTPHGIGQITEVDSVRGRRSFRVAGRNFNVWVDETSLHLASGEPDFSDASHHQHQTEGHWDAHDGGEDPDNYPHFYGSLDSTIEQGDVNHDNSTTLPYNPTPQHNVELFRDDQTIQPGEYDIDPDDRLHSSDSLTGNDKEPNRPYPGPNPDLFAKHSGLHDKWEHLMGNSPEQLPPAEWDGPPQHAENKDHGVDAQIYGYASRTGGSYTDHERVDDSQWPKGMSEADLLHAYEYQDKLHHPESLPFDAHGVPQYTGARSAAFEDLDKDAPQWGEDRWHSDLPDGPDRTFGKDAAYHYAGPGLLGGEDEEIGQGGSRGMNPGSIPVAHPDGPVQGGINTSTGMPGLNIPEGGPFGNMDSSPKVGGYHYAVGEEMPGVGASETEGGAEFHPANPFPGPISDTGMPQLLTPGVSHLDSQFGKVEGAYRPAGLSSRYAHFDIEAHDGMDQVSQFRRDPEGFLHTAGYLQSGDQDYLANKYASYTSLLATDPQMHTAALQEMQEKAIRMARTGSVLVRDSSVHGVYASVTDPNDGNTYDTLLTKAGSWQCGCEWGRWAFHQGSVHMCPHAYAAYGSTRKAAYSSEEGHRDEWLHYAQEHGLNPNDHMAINEFNDRISRRTADVVDRFKSWSKEQNDDHIDEASIDDFLNQDDQLAHHEDVDKLYKYVLSNPDEQKERKYDVGYSLDPEKSYKESSKWDEATPEEDAHWAQQEKQQGQEFQHEGPPTPQRHADALRQQPKSLTPGLKVVPEGEDEQWVDVTKDERETTGPDQIVHFSAIVAKLHQAQMEDSTDNGLAAQDADKEVGMPSASSTLVASLHMADTGTIGLDQDPAANKGQTPAPSSGSVTGRPDHPGLTQLRHWMDPQANPPGQGQAADGYNPAPNGGSKSGPAPAGGGDQSQTADYAKWYGQGQGGGNGPTADYKNWYGQGQGGGQQQFDPHGQQTGVGLISDPAQSALKPGQAKPSNYDDMVKNTVGEGNQGHNTGLGAGANGAMGTGSGYGGAGFQGDGGTGGAWNKSNETSGIHGDYTVKPGDTLNDIAGRSGLSVQDIAKQNNIADPNAINSGTQLKLPGATGGSGQPTGETHAPAGQNPVANPASPPAANPAGGAGGSGAIPGGTQLADQTAPAGQQPKIGPPAIPAAPTPPKVGPPATSPVGEAPKIGPPATPPLPGQQKTTRRHLAEQSDASLLDKLRDMSADTPEDSLGHMDSRNDKLRDLVDELQNERGMDVSFMVAHLIEADNPSDGNADFSGVSAPQDPDMDFAGSGPDPKTWFSDSGSYVDAKERPHHVDDWTEGDGDIIKFNDGRSAPQQGPRSAARQYDEPHPTPQPRMPNNGWQDHYDPEEDWDGSFSEATHQKHADFDTPPSMGGVEGMPANEYGTGPEDSMGQGQSMVSHLHRVGGGPRQAVRVDPGFRGHQAPRHASAPPEDFGYDGDIAPPSGGNEATDIVAAFQRSGAAEGIFGQQASSNDDIAGAAQHFLRTAGRKFSPDEQRVLEAENHPLGARNLPTDDDLAGTHYLLGL